MLGELSQTSTEFSKLLFNSTKDTDTWNFIQLIVIRGKGEKFQEMNMCFLVTFGWKQKS